MCRTCWGEFHDGDEPSLTLKDKRVVTKTPNGKYTRSVTIKALMARCQNPAEYLTDHVHDFCSSVTVMSKNQSKIRIGKVPAEIKVATAGKKGCSGQRVFALTDNCAAIGAADVPPYFTGKAQSCNFGVKGVNAQTEAMKIGESQSGALVLTDDTGEDFIGRYGGGLKQGHARDAQ